MKSNRERERDGWDGDGEIYIKNGLGVEIDYDDTKYVVLGFKLEDDSGRTLNA